MMTMCPVPIPWREVALPPREHGLPAVALDPDVGRLGVPAERVEPDGSPRVVDDHRPGLVSGSLGLGAEDHRAGGGARLTPDDRDLRGMQVGSRAKAPEGVGVHPLGEEVAADDQRRRRPGDAKDEVAVPGARDLEPRAHRDPLAGVEGALEDEAGPAAVGVGAQHARVAPAPRAADQHGTAPARGRPRKLIVVRGETVWVPGDG